MCHVPWSNSSASPALAVKRTWFGIAACGSSASSVIDDLNERRNVSHGPYFKRWEPGTTASGPPSALTSEIAMNILITRPVGNGH